jgi:O-antigen/teichoic acid export membrane protein
MTLIASDLETGYFATPYRILEVFVFIPNLLVASVFPLLARAAHDDDERFGTALARTFEIAVIGGAWLALSVVLAADFAIDVIAGAAGQPSVAVLRIQGIALLATFLAVASQFGLLSLRRHWSLVVANAGALALTLLLGALLVPGLGARGAAIATVGGELVLALGTLGLLVRSTPTLPFRARVVPQVLLATTLAAARALVPGIHDALRVVAATVIYFGVLAALGAIPAEVRAALVPARRVP